MRVAVLLCIMSLILSASYAQRAIDNRYNLLIGTYSNQDNSNGIQVYTFDTQTGDFAFRSKNVEITNPSYLAISKDRKHVFSVSEAGQGNGTVNAFSFDPKEGMLTFINSVPSAGDSPCYVSVGEKQDLVFVGNYSSGTLSAIRLTADGSLDPSMQTIAHKGSSVVQRRQEKPHVHAVVLSPDNHYLFVPDLGTDKVNAYSVDGSRHQPLMAAGEVTTAPGSGPRHLTFHPNGKYAYLIQELDATVTAFDYKDGKLNAKQTITLLSPDFKGKVGAADIHVSPDGKFLYGSNRGEANEITIYSIGKDGKLTYAGRQSTLGKTPRNFVIDPTGNFLLAANQDTHDIIIFKRDKKSGLLTDTGKKIQVDRPVCLKFVAIE